ncbi:MAG: hypothetical protein IJB81_08325 [Clostridia bacterium]|nr:hypothetical protein [Clostridia bacterium]
MPETLAAFHARVDGFTRSSLPQEGGLVTKPLLTEKIGPDGRMLPFFGNTMIYDLPQAAKLAIARRQLLLHHRCAGMLAEPITPATLHLTLHDLLNGTDAAALAAPVRKTGEQARALLAQLRAEHLPPVHLTSTAAFNMVNGSVALGFTPDTETDCAAIMNLHARFQEIVALSYPLTPHVTLAYYRPGCHDNAAVAALRGALEAINALPPVQLTLDLQSLFYCTFTDMNTYIPE